MKVWIAPPGNGETRRVRKRFFCCCHNLQFTSLLWWWPGVELLCLFHVVWGDAMNYGTCRNVFVHPACAQVLSTRVTDSAASNHLCNQAKSILTLLETLKIHQLRINKAQTNTVSDQTTQQLVLTPTSPPRYHLNLPFLKLKGRETQPHRGRLSPQSAIRVVYESSACLGLLHINPFSCADTRHKITPAQVHLLPTCGAAEWTNSQMSWWVRNATWPTVHTYTHRHCCIWK